MENTLTLYVRYLAKPGCRETFLRQLTTHGVIDAIRRSPLSDRAEILEQDAGLHFLMVLPTDLDDRSLRRRAEAMGLRLALLSDYYSQPAAAPQHILVVNYAGIDMDRLPEGLRRLAQLWEEPSCMTN